MKKQDKYVSSHPEIEKNLIDFYEQHYKDDDFSIFVHSNFQNLRVFFEQISPTFLSKLTFSWYDVQKEGTDWSHRVWAYKNLLEFFRYYNDFKSEEFWITWANKMTYHYCEETKNSFLYYVKDNFPLKDESYKVFLESIKTEKDKAADSAHLVNVIEKSFEHADKMNSWVPPQNSNYLLTLEGY